MSQPSVFKEVQNVVLNFKPSQADSKSFYELANAYSKWYFVIYKSYQEDSICIEDLILATTIIVDVVGDETVDFSFIPEHIMNYVSNVLGSDYNKANELHLNCEYLLKNVSKYVVDAKMVSLFLQKSLLAIALAALDNIASNDIYLLINKCVIFDHMGNQAYPDKKFVPLLEMVTKRVQAASFSPAKEFDILFYLGMLNYRLNNYSVAKDFLQRHTEALIEAVNNKTISPRKIREATLQIPRNLISLAYCFEKTNTAQDIDSAIVILESIIIAKSERKLIDCNVFGKKSSIRGFLLELEYDALEKDVKVEIYHALSHFYNERAVFHSNNQSDNESRLHDIKIAREYISIAKDMDAGDSLHSCHGMICFEDNDYYRATKIYEEALQIEAVASNEALKNEMLFYYAQAKSRINEAKEASASWKAFEDYCEKIKDHDALIQFHVVKAKYDLAHSTFEKKSLNDLKVLLRNVSKYSLSKYVPESISKEHKRIVKTLHVFYAFKSIIDGEIPFADGIEEVIYNLEKYLESTDSKLTYETLIAKDCITVPTINGNKVQNDGLFILEYNTVQLLGFGDYSNLSQSMLPLSFVGDISNDCESSVVDEIKKNKHVDVVLLAPTSNFATNDSRKKFMRSIIKDGICIVVFDKASEVIAKELNDRGPTASPIYLAKNTTEAIQIAFCFKIYETMRKRLIAPTPMLGLVPLVESKSYSFQAGKRLEKLLLPPSTTQIDKTQQKPLAKAIKRFDIIQEKFRIEYKFPKLHASVLTHYTDLLHGRTDVLLVAFFPEYSTSESLPYTAPYRILCNSIKETINYICPSQLNETYDMISVFKKFIGFNEVYESIEGAKQNDDFCNGKECIELSCEAFLTNLGEASEPSSSVLKILENLFSINKVKKDVQCIVTYVKHNEHKGILLVVTKHEDANTCELHEICKILHNVKQPNFYTETIENNHVPSVTKLPVEEDIPQALINKYGNLKDEVDVILTRIYDKPNYVDLYEEGTSLIGSLTPDTKTSFGSAVAMLTEYIAKVKVKG